MPLDILDIVLVILYSGKNGDGNLHTHVFFWDSVYNVGCRLVRLPHKSAIAWPAAAGLF